MGRTRGKPTLQREEIVIAALSLIDTSGIDGLSMRRLGSALGVHPTTVYHHFPDKQAIVLAVVDEVFSSMRLRRERSWEAAFRGWARAYRRLVLAHPNLVFHILADPEAVAIAAGHAAAPLVVALEQGGVGPRDAMLASGVLADYVNGVVFAEASAAARGDPIRGIDRAFAEGVELILTGVRARATDG